MRMKIITAAALVVVFAMPAFAANEFYLVQNSVTKVCLIVEAKPTIESFVMVVVGDVHETKAAAESARKADKTCITL